MRFALSLVLFAFSAPAFAVDGVSDSSRSVPVATTQPAESKDAEEAKICKRIAATESRLGAKKLCMTAKQWKEYSNSSDS